MSVMYKRILAIGDIHGEWDKFLSVYDKIAFNPPEDLLVFVGDYVDRGVGTHLSGGEIKRIEIATVLLRHSKVSVFDEPEAGIDLWSFNNLVRVFENIRDKRESSLVIISHQERILSIADEIVMIQNGKVGLRGDRKSIFPRLLCKNDDCEHPCM